MACAVTVLDGQNDGKERHVRDAFLLARPTSRAEGERDYRLGVCTRHLGVVIMVMREIVFMCWLMWRSNGESFS